MKTLILPQPDLVRSIFLLKIYSLLIISPQKIDRTGFIIMQWKTSEWRLKTDSYFSDCTSETPSGSCFERAVVDWKLPSPQQKPPVFPSTKALHSTVSQVLSPSGIFLQEGSFYIMSASITFCGGQWRRKLFCWLRVDGKNNQLLAFIAPEGKYLILTSPQIWPNISWSMKAAFPGFFTIYVNCFCRKMIKCGEPEHKNELLLIWAQRMINLTRLEHVT